MNSEFLAHYNLNHDPNTGRFTGKMRTGSLVSGIKTITNKYGKESIEKYKKDAKTKELITRYGRPGLKYGDWVMKGENSVTNYVLSCKWQVGLGNQHAPRSSGRTYVAEKRNVRKPKGWGIDGWIKSLFAQRKYHGKKAARIETTS